MRVIFESREGGTPYQRYEARIDFVELILGDVLAARFNGGLKFKPIAVTYGFE